jgi:P-type E1-E2 ATPase
VKVQTSTLNEELGQIQHLFTDKTGTLTRNYMSFKHMVVGNQTYGYD